MLYSSVCYSTVISSVLLTATALCSKSVVFHCNWDQHVLELHWCCQNHTPQTLHWELHRCLLRLSLQWKTDSHVHQALEIIQPHPLLDNQELIWESNHHALRCNIALNKQQRIRARSFEAISRSGSGFLVHYLCVDWKPSLDHCAVQTAAVQTTHSSCCDLVDGTHCTSSENQTIVHIVMISHWLQVTATWCQVQSQNVESQKYVPDISPEQLVRIFFCLILYLNLNQGRSWVRYNLIICGLLKKASCENIIIDYLVSGLKCKLHRPEVVPGPGVWHHWLWISLMYACECISRIF